MPLVQLIKISKGTGECMYLLVCRNLLTIRFRIGERVDVDLN